MMFCFVRITKKTCCPATTTTYGSLETMSRITRFLPLRTRTFRIPCDSTCKHKMLQISASLHIFLVAIYNPMPHRILCSGCNHAATLLFTKHFLLGLPEKPKLQTVWAGLDLNFFNDVLLTGWSFPWLGRDEGVRRLGFTKSWDTYLRLQNPDKLELWKHFKQTWTDVLSKEIL
jgi:hypothetical protein